jgi:hypothetical protein
MEWIPVAQDRDKWQALVNVVMKLQVLWEAGNFLTSWANIGFPRTLIHEVTLYVYISIVTYIVSI